MKLAPANVWISSVKDAIEGSSSTSAEFVVTRDGNLSTTVTANLAWGGTATDGVDYASLSFVTTATFMSGSATYSIYVDTGPSYGDFTIEGPETITLTLSAGTNATIVSPGSATLTIFDDDLGSGGTAPAGQAFIGGGSFISLAPGTPESIALLPANGSDGPGIMQALGDQRGQV